MSQHDLTIANQGFPAFRADLNDALQALGSCQSGTSAPSPTFANQLWYDTTNNILKIRNEDNDAWISIATLDQSGDLVALLVANTVNSVGDASISGLTVGKGGGAVATNTVVGVSSLNNGSQSGTNTTAIGANVLTANTSGDQNTAVGRYSLPNNTTGSYGVAMGYGALISNTTGSSNTALGTTALYYNTTADNNTAIGYQAGYSNTTAYSMVAVGALALYANTTGSNNVAVGAQGDVYAALRYNTTGAKNVAVGSGALAFNTTASNNTAVGYQAGYTNSTGTNNSILGHQAGYSLTTGSFSTFAGQGAGYSVTTGAGNTGIGQGAGFGLTTGNYNCFVGPRASTNYGAGELVTTGSKNTILGGYNGNQGGLDIRTASNYIVLSDGDGNPRVVVTDTGDVCIGRTSSQGRLGVERSNADWCYNSNQTGTGGKNHFRFTDNSTPVGTITSSGSTTSYNTSSDYRLKENVAPMTGALAKVTTLKPVTYKWKIDGSDGQGFIAHELQEVFPEAVTGAKDALDKDGNILPQGIDTSHLVATLVASIQELNAKLEAQALEIATLKAK